MQAAQTLSMGSELEWPDRILMTDALMNSSSSAAKILSSCGVSGRKMTSSTSRQAVFHPP